jgi:dTDP-4-dehydrorhamnose reductase
MAGCEGIKKYIAPFEEKLAHACKTRDIAYVHISTDAVFDGEKDGFYTEEDSPNPMGVYARTKLDGEWAVLTENPNAIVARVNFYGWSLAANAVLRSSSSTILPTAKA